MRTADRKFVIPGSVAIKPRRPGMTAISGPPRCRPLVCNTGSNDKLIDAALKEERNEIQIYLHRVAGMPRGGAGRDCSVFGWLGRYEWRNRFAAGEGFLERFVLVVAFVALAPLALILRFLAGRFVLGVFDVLAIAIRHGGALHRCGRSRTQDVM